MLPTDRCRCAVNGKQLDLYNADIVAFTRTLNMKEGYLERVFE